MKDVTQELMRDFNIESLGYDFMGYPPSKGDIPTFHHLLQPAREGGPYAYWNGVVLYTTPHQYLHVIESIDYFRFLFLTAEMNDMKIKEFLDPVNLHRINLLLTEFEETHENYLTKKRTRLIKDGYLNRKKF